MMLLTAFFGALVGCSDGSSSSNSGNNIKVSISGESTVTAGKTITLTATVTPAQDDATYEWKITDGTEYASFDGNNTLLTKQTTENTVALYGVETGTAKVTVTVAGKTSTKYTVNVEAAKIGFSLNTTAITTAKDDTFTLTAMITNDDALADKTISWESSDKDVATVSVQTDSKMATVSTKKDGTATITASVGGKKATCTVTVKTTIGGESTVWWRADDYDAVNTKWTSDETFGIMTATGTTESTTAGGTTHESKATLEGKSATVGDYSFTKAFVSGGAGNETYNSLKFTLSQPTKLTVYAAANGENGTRNLMLKVGSAEATSLGTTTMTAEAFSYDYTETETVTCYLWSSASSILIYAVCFEYTQASEPETLVYPTAVSLDKAELFLDTSDSENKKATLKATIANQSAVTEDYDTLTWTSSDTSVATVNASGVVSAKSAGTATITVTTINGRAAMCTVTVTGVAQEGLALDDDIPGYASLGTSYNISATPVTVTTRDELVNAVKSAGVIIIDGMIDMSDGMMPTTGGGTTEKLDALVKEQTTSLHASDSTKYPQVFETYEAFKTAYAASCTTATEGDSPLDATLSKLNNEYAKTIVLSLRSNTTLIGKGAGSGIQGGSIGISGVQNIQIRNLTILDAYDPFPHHESNDGYNAQHDNISISGASKNIWIDHCTLQDTMTLSSVKTNGSTSEKWQTYDGLCDMKNDCTNITISNCKFYNHDKTMLIGSSDSDGDNSKRFITLYQNYFLNCGQRLPMVRNTTIHILNNYYDASSPRYAQSYCIGSRKNSIIYAENNYFGSGINYSFKDSYGTLYASGNTDKAKNHNTPVTATTLFSAAVNAYSYTAHTAEEAKALVEKSAGAGQTFNF